jgi:hypothetical protein
MARRVFISYRSEDKSSADRVCAALERDNIPCWIAPRDIGIGREWAAAIVSGLDTCSHFILILSSNSQNAKQISREAELADARGLPIITLRIEDVKPPPGLVYFLGNLQWLDAFGNNFDTALGRLAEVITKSGDSSAAAAISAKPPAPASRPQVAEPSSALKRSGLPPYTYAIAALLIVAIGLAVWFSTRTPHPAPGPAPNPVSDPAKEASAFGISYLQTRDSGDLEHAYAMLGPDLRAKWSRQAFNSEAGALQTKGRPSTYAPTGACTVRERGAYTCDYHLSYSDGHSDDERLVIANHDGTWAIAKDRMPSAS